MNDASLPTVRTVAALRQRVKTWRGAGERVALVPTMGALHDGHLSLLRLARNQADRVIASVFVNPTQFGPTEDFAAYPRDEAQDSRVLRQGGCDLLYAPGVEEMYPSGFDTTVRVAALSEPLCSASRPRHFDGVATVVTKLLVQAGPDVAVFGEKDWQQLAVIRRLVRDLDLPVDVRAAPTVRAEDGLALSSRNAYLDEADRRTAAGLNRVLAEAAAVLRAGAPVERVERESRHALERLGFAPVEYLEVRHPDTLAPAGPGPLDGPARVFAAARLSGTRLIDNLAV